MSFSLASATHVCGWEAVLEHGEATSVQVPRKEWFSLPLATVCYQQQLSTGRGLEVIYTIFAWLLAGLVLDSIITVKLRWWWTSHVQKTVFHSTPPHPPAFPSFPVVPQVLAVWGCRLNIAILFSAETSQSYSSTLVSHVSFLLTALHCKSEFSDQGWE